MEDEEIWQVWQPVTHLKGVEFEMFFVEIVRHNDYLKIVLEDQKDNLLEIVYDQLEEAPLEYAVWAFRHSTELGSLHFPTKKQDVSTLVDADSQRFFKVINSEFIASFDNNWYANKQLFPYVEHHMYITGDEIFEVVSNYEPKFICKTKS